MNRVVPAARTLVVTALSLSPSFVHADAPERASGSAASAAAAPLAVSVAVSHMTRSGSAEQTTAATASHQQRAAKPAPSTYRTWAKNKVYVVDRTNSSWQVHKTIEVLDDNSPLDLVYVKKCPPKAAQCVDVGLGSLPGDVVGRTDYRYRPFSDAKNSGGTILSAKVVLDGAWGKKTSPHNRRADVCHEVGHAVGLEHVNSLETCMNPVLYSKTADHPSAATYALLRKMYAAGRPVAS